MNQKSIGLITRLILWSEMIIFGHAAEFLCKEVLYNKSTHFCCGEKVFTLRDHLDRERSCCRLGQSTIEEEPYIKDTHWCCGIIRPKNESSGNEWHCCNGDRPYKKNKHICCGMHLTPLSASGSLNECCDGKFYNINFQVCCRNTLHQRKENPIDEESMECCGDERYDSKNFKCEHSSEDNPKIKRNELEDCNGQEYNMTTHICCIDQVLQLPDLKDRESYSCCGDQLFKTTHMRCCSNSHLIKKSKSCCGNESYDPVHQRCCSGVPNNLLTHKSKCCGTMLIKAHDICCNGTHGDINSQCCGDTLISRKDSCCEDRALEASKICCKERNGATKQIEKGKVSDNACCIYRKHHTTIYSPYDEMNQICDKEGVSEKLAAPNESRTILNSTPKIPTRTKLIIVGFPANSNVSCSRKMNFKDIRVIKINHSNGNLILHVQLEGNHQAGARKRFQVILRERFFIQVGRIYRIYSAQKIGFTRKFYKSEKDVIIRKNKRNIRHFDKFC